MTLLTSTPQQQKKLSFLFPLKKSKICFSCIIKCFLLILLFSVSSTIHLHAQCDPQAKIKAPVSLCYNSAIEVTPDMVLEPIYSSCLTNLIVEIYVDGDSIGNVVNYNLAGRTLPFIVRDTTSGKTSEGSLVVQRDEIAPTAVCDEFTVTTLSAETGSVVLCADNFDSGSYDNCELKYIKIRRMEEVFFKDCIRFDCDDVGAPVRIVLQVTDFENLTAECMIALTVDEKSAPMINCPDDVTVDCTRDIDGSGFPKATAMDNCGTPTITYVDDDQRNDCGVGIVTRTFTAEDNAGNTSTCVQIITLEQNKTPLIFFPSDKTVFDCNKAFDTELAGEPVLHDYCSNLLISNEDHIFRAIDNCSFKIQRIWSILDWCSGNEKRDTQIIKVFDQLSPTFTTPEGSLDKTFTCPDDVVLTPPDAADDCGEATVTISTNEIIDGDCPNQFTQKISYIATDECGNVSEPFIVNISINDDVAPTADPIPGIGPFQCFEDIPIANPEDVTNEADNCGGLVTVTHLGDSPDPGCSGFITRTYQLADECNNTSLLTQQIEIQDDTAPTTNPLPELGPFACFPDLPEPDVSIVQATDNCGASVTITHVGDSPNPGCNGIVVRTYRATDECGNSSEVTQNLIVRDDEAPTADALPEIGPFSCYADRPAPDVNIVKAMDNCGLAVTVTFISDSTDPGCSGTITRTYRITDVCDNAAEVTQIILIDDNIAPTAEPIPALGPFVCASEVPAPDINVVTGESDNCGGFVSVRHDRDEPAPSCTGMYRRFYQITDECGNTSELMQEIALNDNVMPTADPLPNLGPFTCITDVPDPDVEAVTGEADNCGMVTVSFVGDSADPGCFGFITRTYRITDECGNFVDLPQQIALNDNIAPTADPIPDAGPFTCVADIPAADVNIVLGESDNCDGQVIVEYVGDSAAPSCEGVIVRTYRISDLCGNSIELTQNITIKDDIAPTASELPPLGPFECFEDRPAPDINLINATDNCGGDVTVEFVSDGDRPVCTGSVIRVYRITDICGNATEIRQSIFIDDNTPPTADTIATIGPFDCVNEVPAPDINVVTGLDDNCDGIPTVSFDRDEAAPNCIGFYRRFYLVTDQCGNTTELMQRIQIMDNVMPTADPLPNLGPFECVAKIPAADIEVVTGEQDNCGGVTVSFLGDSDDPGCSGFVTRTYRLTDDCGNVSDITQQIEINDNIAPIVDPLPTSDLFNCLKNIPDPDINIVMATDDSCNDMLIIEHVGDELIPDDPNKERCKGTVVRTYRVSDQCGNAVEVSQSFDYEDTNIPFLPGDVDLTLGPFNCYTDIPIPDNTPFLDVMDSCDVTVRITVLLPDSGDPGCEGTVIRNWKLEDECRNRLDTFQVISIKDTLPPTADPLSPLGTFSCLSDIPAPDSTLVMNVSDGCGSKVTVRFLEDISQGNVCPDTITRVYQLSDECGNTSTIPQQIILNDEEAPTVQPLGNLGTFSCYDNIPPADNSLIVADDNCPEPLIITSELGPDPGCNGIVTRTYTVMDRCGNMTKVPQIITILDDVPPVITCPRDIVEPIFSNSIGDCQAFVQLVATATDNCNRPITFTNDSQFADDPTNGADASGEYPLGVTFVKFTADDGCGNTDECTVRVEVIDIESPTLTCTTVRKDIGIDAITGDTIAVLTVADITIRGEVFDFCTPITTFFEKDTFTCDDLLTTPNPYTLTAIDTFDNTNVCSPNNGVFLSDPLGLCGPTPPPAIVGGRIVSVTGEQIEGVMVMANEQQELMSMSDQEGNYLISNLMSERDYMIKPEKDDDHLNGVSTFDIIVISQHILGYKEFENPYHFLAADVNRSGSISASDLVTLREVILGKINHFPNNTSWRFINGNYQFTNPANPLGESLPEEQFFENMGSSNLDTDFTGFKVGDVNGDAKYNKASSVRSAASTEKLTINVEDQLLEPGQEYEIAFRAKDFGAIMGYQFTLNFDRHALELVDLMPGEVEGISIDNFNTNRSEEGLITTNFINSGNNLLSEEAILFTLKFKAYAKYHLSELMHISSDITKAEAYSQQGEQVSALNPSLSFSESDNNNFTIVENTFQLYQNRPNPFNNQTIIGFDLPEDAVVTFRVFDISGRQLQMQQGEYIKGYNEIQIAGDKLPSSGIFYYQLDTPFGSATRKMVLLE